MMVAGSRRSKLAKAQTAFALAFLQEDAGVQVRVRYMDTPGDRDRSTSIENAAEDFFTRDLDNAVRDGRIDFAVHSAKDLPSPMAEDLDWFWLPVREDRRDCWVVREGGIIKKIGVSSARRTEFARQVFPDAELAPIRGAIDDRIAQLQAGKFDAVLMAMAGLKRLYPHWFKQGARPPVRIDPIPLDTLQTPEAQGALAVVFHRGNPEMQRIRARYVKAVRFVSAGVGDCDLITVRGKKDIEESDVILADELTGFTFDEDERCVHVGKRCARHSMEQSAITKLICDEARKGKRVVRLKGGDAGLFGRLAEETDALTKLGMSFVVRPGVSALTAATTPNGLLLTRRGESAGFSVFSPRSSGAINNKVLFMSARVWREQAREMIKGGVSPDTKVAAVYGAATPHERVEHGTLATLKITDKKSPVLIVVGDAASTMFPTRPRVLLTCSEAVMDRAVTHFEDRGFRPIKWSLIKLRPKVEEIELFPRYYHAIVFTSPSSVRIFFDKFNGDRRQLPLIWTCGAGTDNELRKYGVHSDLMPESDFSAEGLIKEINRLKLTGRRILRFRSKLAGDSVAASLAQRGAEVADIILYDNVMVRKRNLPDFDAVHFASASAVKSFLSQYGADKLNGKQVLVMGKPTMQALPPSLRGTAEVEIV